jgi:hypothetical protein
MKACMKVALIGIVALALNPLNGCGGGGNNGGGSNGGGGNQEATPTSISDISYAPNPVAPGGTAVFTATVECSGAGTCPQSITWSASQGSFAGSTYTAPATSGSYTVTATATGFPVSSTATVTVASAMSVTLTCPPLVQIGIQGNIIPPTTYVCTGSASDEKAVTYTASGVGMSINSSTGALSVTASDSDIGSNNYLPVVITATASDGTTKASATVLVTDWFLAENGQGTQIMTSMGAVVQSFSSLKYSAEAFAPDHLSFVGVNLDNLEGFDVYEITVTSTNGTISIGTTKTGTITFASEFTDVETPSYSHDGKYLVFVGVTNPSPGVVGQGVYKMTSDGKTAEQELSTEPPATGSVSVGAYPHFTADDKSIVFEHQVSGWQIWEMAADGSNQAPLFTTPGMLLPFPTADGKYLMLWMNNGIYQANSNGSGAELVIQAPVSNFGSNGVLEAISPDGKRVMYLMKDPNVGGPWFLWTANVDGTDQVQITPSSGTIAPESWGD